MKGFIQLNRSEEAIALLKDKNAFVLLTQIAIRARRNNCFDTDGLYSGEALIGDHERIGLTMREYRTAKKHLAKYGFSTFKTTNKGTVAKLLDTRIFDINEEASDNSSDKQPTVKRQLTRMKKIKKFNNQNTNTETFPNGNDYSI